MASLFRTFSTHRNTIYYAAETHPLLQHLSPHSYTYRSKSFFKIISVVNRHEKEVGEKDLMGKDIELDIFSMNHDVSYKLSAFRCAVKCHHSYGTISHITVGLLWYTLTANLVECRVHVCRCP